MAKTQKSKDVERAREALTVAHRERLIEELRADRKLAAEYLNAAAKNGDLRVYAAALRTVAQR